MEKLKYGVYEYMPGFRTHRHTHTQTYAHTHKSDYYKSQDTVYVWGRKKVKSRMEHRKGASRVTDKILFLD